MEIVKKELSNLLNKVNVLFVPSEREHRNLSITVFNMLDDLDKLWTLKSKNKKDLNKKEK